MKEIIIESPKWGAKIALVDDSDYDYLIGFKWYVCKSRNTFYALTRMPKPENKTGFTSISMHKLLLPNIQNGLVIDHKSQNGMENYRSNLRIATEGQNKLNTVKRKSVNGVPVTSKYKGVSFRYHSASYINKKGEKIKYRSTKGKWMAAITLNRKRIYLGYFDNEEDAARAYDAMAIKLHKEFASLNFPL